MFGIEILDVIIGLAFVYLLCSLVCSAINEWIAKIFDIRARDLEKELIKILDSDVKKKLYAHPLIQTITRKVTWIESLWNRTARPAHIDPKFFSMALADILRKEGKPNPDNGKKANESGDDFKSLGDGIKNVTAAAVAGGSTNAQTPTPAAPVSALQTIIDSVEAEITKAEDKIAAFRGKVEDWFNASMEQMSILYKRKSRLIIFFIAFPLCFGLNIDTITLTQYLYQDDTARAQLVAAAIKYVEEHPTGPQVQTGTQNPTPDTPGTAASQPGNNTNPAAAADITAPKTNPNNNPIDNPNPQDNQKNPLERAKKLQVQLQELGLPIGWNCDADPKNDIRGFPTNRKEGFIKFLGLFLTALAVSMGAPFWFDLLQKMIGLRKTLQPPNEEQKPAGK